MKKKLIQIFIISLLLIPFSACDNSSNELKDYQLSVVVSTWSGWSSAYESEEEAFLYAIDKNAEILIEPEVGSPLTITITKITKDSITIKTDQTMSIDQDGTIDLGSKETVFEVSLNEGLVITTTTFDEGTTFHFELVKK